MKYLIFGAVLGSMALTSTPVKSQAKDTLSEPETTGSEVNPVSDKGTTKENWSRFIEAVVSSGQNFNFVDGYAQAIGLPAPMSAQRWHVSSPVQGNTTQDDRDVQIIISAEHSGTSQNKIVPVCVYFHRGQGTKQSLTLRYFRVSLDGKLERAITLTNKRDSEGKNIRESRKRIEENIHDAEVQKSFRAEWSYWLNDWLKKQQPTKSVSVSQPTAPK